MNRAGSVMPMIEVLNRSRSCFPSHVGANSGAVNSDTSNSGIVNSGTSNSGTVNSGIAAALLDKARAAMAAAWSESGITYGPTVDHALRELREDASTLSRFDPAAGLNSSDEALAFWINVYNTMVIHGALHFQVRRTMTEVRGFFKKTRYDIGGQSFSLDVIEHGLLRANRGHPLRIFLPQLMPWDGRRRLVIIPADARIHFALNCGAMSCPPIKHYDAAAIDEQLDQAASAFVSGALRIDPSRPGVIMSRIFSWYWRDFGATKRKQLNFALRYVSDDERRELEEAAAHGIRSEDYDWSFA